MPPPRIRPRRELDPPQHFRKFRRPQHGELLVRGRRHARVLSTSRTATSRFGSAPTSPLPLTVDVIAQIVTVPSRSTRPVRLRRPAIAGAHGSAVAALLPTG